jgi:hypothetical protein
MKPLLATVVLAAPILLGATGMAAAQMHQPMGMFTSTFDPAQLPEFKGKVAQYTVSPRGEVDGLILDDGTEVNVPPHLSSALVFSVKPGDAVSIHGLKARVVPMIAAVTITNVATGVVVGAGQPGGHGDGAHMEVTGVVKEVLHTPRGDVGGALLQDGTVVRMPPPAAKKLASLLVVGQPIAVRGMGVANPLGKSVFAMEAGPSMDKLTHIEMPHWRHGPDGGPDGEHGMMGHPGGMMGHPGMMGAPDAPVAPATKP